MNTISNEVYKVFKILINDTEFINTLENSFKNIMEDHIIDIYDVPEFISIIIEIYNKLANIKITKNKVDNLIFILYKHMINKLNLIPIHEREKYEKLVLPIIKLAHNNIKDTNIFSKIFCCNNNDENIDINSIDEIQN
jgi:hypothetical protein